MSFWSKLFGSKETRVDLPAPTPTPVVDSPVATEEPETDQPISSEEPKAD